MVSNPDVRSDYPQVDDEKHGNDDIGVEKNQVQPDKGKDVDLDGDKKDNQCFLGRLWGTFNHNMLVSLGLQYFN